ncbi:protein eva-1-like [Culicoides brevitarsis]|uniref:protein eva-1-like n=1 Tax=Culicoides brevitarsis TaxID=469753 RepID=UPI00307B846C
MSLTKWMNQCFHYYYTNNNRITGTSSHDDDENRVKSGVLAAAVDTASSANNNKYPPSTNSNTNSGSCNNNKITLLLILSIISTSTTVHAAADDYFEIRVDPLALLSETLRQFRRTGCERAFITLNCPRGTSISIDIAQYNNIDEQKEIECPSTTGSITDSTLSNVVHSNAEVEIKPPESCNWPRAIQYSLLQTVVESCQKKQHCRFNAPPRTFGGDPCPGKERYIEIVYKCRPYEFRKKVACENDVVQLICNPYSRIALYSASYGRTEHETLQCANPAGIREETCLATRSTEVAMDKCHGKRKCNIKADSQLFGKPCSPGSLNYLKVVYTCVPRKVLQNQFNVSEADEQMHSDVENEQDEFYNDDQVYVGNEAPKLQAPPSHTATATVNDTLAHRPSNAILIAQQPKQKTNEETLEENQERFFLYLILSVSTGILLCLLVIITRFIINRRHNDDSEGSNGGKIPASTTGETALSSSRVSGDVTCLEAETKFPAQELETSYMPTIVRNEQFHHQDYVLYNASSCSTPPPPHQQPTTALQQQPPIASSLYNQSNVSQTPYYFVSASTGKIIANPHYSQAPSSILSAPSQQQQQKHPIVGSAAAIPNIGVSTLPHHLVGPLPPHFYINSGTLQSHHMMRPASELSAMPPTSIPAATATTTLPTSSIDKPITSNSATSVTTSNMTEGHPNENPQQQQQQKIFSNNSNSSSDRQQMQYFYG